MNQTRLVPRTAPAGPLDVAVVIPTRNRPDDLQITVRSLFSQTCLPRQLIIVDQSSTNESLQAVSQEFRAASQAIRNAVPVECIHDTAITGASAARNRAIPLITAPITLFLDDDVILEPRFIEAIQDTYRSYEVTGVSGTITNYSFPSRFARLWTSLFALGPFHDDRQPVYWRANSRKAKGPVRVTRFGAGLMSFWTTIVKSHRFDENLTGACVGEDVDYCAHIRDSVLVITPEARLFHKQSPAARTHEYWLQREVRTAWYLFRRNWNHGLRNRLCFVWLNTGYLLIALLAAIRRISMLPLKEFLKGIENSRSLVSPSTPVGSGSRVNA